MAKMKVIGSRKAEAAEDLQGIIDSIVEACDSAGVKVSAKNITDDISVLSQLGLESQGLADKKIRKDTGAVLTFTGTMNVLGISADVQLWYYSGPRQTIIYSDDFNTTENRNLSLLDKLSGILGKTPFLTNGKIDVEGNGRCILGSEPGCPVKSFLSGLAGFAKLADIIQKQADSYFKASAKYVKYMNIRD